MVLSLALAYIGGMATFSQVFLSLPMALDLLGPPSFLLLSLLFTLHHFLYSTLRLLCKNTILAPLIFLLSLLSPVISGACVLLTLYYYLYPPQAGNTAGHILVNVLPYLYASILRWVSPLFTLLEGISTLLVIQVVGRVGKGWADDDEKEEGLEWRSLVGLVVAALVYSAGLWLIIWAFPAAPFPAFLLGAVLASTLFLSFIGFSLRRTNVLETSLVLFYVAYSAWISAAEGAMEPRQYGSSWLSHDWAVPKSVSAPNVNTLAHIAYGNLFDSLWHVSLSLPPHLLLSLIYRVVVLHFAARIVPVIRKSTGWDGESDAVPNFWDGRSLGEEPANMRITTIVLSYRRPILIAVYTHLLLLDAGSQTWWRWINITLFLAVWSLELLLDADDDAESSVGRWKVE
ncbi:putative protein [Vanrija pseudolonga]|uniref:Purtative protein n=1 Tax=Vanrija pseudolonga TaxID=143232 RepID=A0AAF0YEU8_9TREE|nr:purtative protein [Vanrija pseudolonga]